jgi:hypothetical protein
MGMQGAENAGYVVPTYEARPGGAWYHFLHGNVPGHQIDFMYRPEVPQGPLTQQHFGHLSRLVKYIEPRSRSAYAFAIGNLSRDDTQYEPGRGGVALIFGLRIRGAKDHQGRQDPPFCHAVAAIGRHLDAPRLLEASVAFYHKLLPDEASQVEGSGWYHTYVRHAENVAALPPLLGAHIAGFDDLPAPLPSALGFRWTAEGATLPKRIVIEHRDGEPFEAVAACAARIAGVLVESDIRWTVLSNGREADVPGGLSIRFVPQREARAEAEGARVLRLEEVPQDPKEIAEQLFGAQAVRISQMLEPRMGWRQLYERQTPEAGAREDEKAPAEKIAVLGEEMGKRPRAQLGVLVGVGVLLAIGGAVAAVVTGTKGSAEAGASATVSAQPSFAAPTAAEPPPASSSAQVALPPKAEEAALGNGAQAAPSGAAVVRKAPVIKVGGEKRKEGGLVFGRRRLDPVE